MTLVSMDMRLVLFVYMWVFVSSDTITQQEIKLEPPYLTKAMSMCVRII